MKIVILGRTKTLHATAEQLAGLGHALQCVITRPPAPEYGIGVEDFRALARRYSARFFDTSSLESEHVREACRDADVAISVNWTGIVQSSFIGLFRIGVLNAHAGKLPRFRGNACPNWAILLGEKEVGLAMHLMEGGRLDSGRVVCEGTLPVDEGTTVTQIHEWLGVSVPDLFVRAVGLLERDPDFSVRYADERAEDGFRCYPRIPEDSHIDWRARASDIHALVRASTHPFSGAYTFVKEGDAVRKLFIYESRVSAVAGNDVAVPGQVLGFNRNTGQAFVRCGSGDLALGSCRYEDEPDTFRPGVRWKSIRTRLGVRPEDWLWHLGRKAR